MTSGPVARLVGQLPYLPRALGLAAAASGGWLVVWLGLLAIESLVPAVVVIASRHVIDALTVGGTGVTWAGIERALGPLALAGGALVVGELCAGASGWVRALQAERVRDHLAELIHAKSIEVDLAFYESEEFHDHLHRARDAAGEGPLVLLESVGSVLGQGVTLATMVAVLVPYGAILPLVLVASTVPACWVVLGTAFRQHAWRVRSTPRLRRQHYLEELLTGAPAAAEVRLYGLGPHLRASYRTLRAGLRTEGLALEREAALARLGARLATLAIVAAGLAWLARTPWRISLGDLAVLAQVFAHGQRVVGVVLANAGAIYRHGLLLGGLFDFLALVPTVADPAAPVALAAAPAREVRFERVGFRYPGETRDALHELDLTLPAGRIVAVVGENGAGKSTLVKLVARLHDPTSGRVTLDGTDLRALALADLRGALAVLFQDPMRFYATAAENVALGDLAAGGSPEAVDRARITAAAEAAGADVPIGRLPGGYDALLGKWFGGAELSVGEWQRLALARAFLRRASVLLLDEPTSAMDSWAEADWLDRFRTLAHGRTALVVTHRFTTAMRADVIHVMHEGRVVESGTHAELVAAGGRYATSWRAQIEARVG